MPPRKTRWLEKRLFRILNSMAIKICDEFGYRYASLKIMLPNDALYEHAGYCDYNGHIRIRIREPNGDFLTIESLIDTLCHEIAHLNDIIIESKEEFTREIHTKKWRRLYKNLLKWCESNVY